MNLYEIKEIHINNTCRYASVFFVSLLYFFFITSDLCKLFIQNLFMLEEITATDLFQYHIYKEYYNVVLISFLVSAK